MTVVDCPFLSNTPAALEELLRSRDGVSPMVVFADVCKEGQNPFAGFVVRLQNAGALPAKVAMRCSAANVQSTGQDHHIFERVDDVVDACASAI